MKSICYCAPLSMILSGEAGLMYGKPVLVLAIDKKVYVKINQSKNSCTKDKKIIDIYNKVTEYLSSKSIYYKEENFTVEIQSDIPKSYVFGYEEACIVSIVGAILTYLTGKDYPKEVIHSIAYEIEKKSLKKNYGLRTTASTYGGMIYFRKEFEFLRNLSLLQIKLPKKFEKQFYIFPFSLNEKKSFNMDNIVGKRYNKDVTETENVLQKLEKNTKQIIVSILKEDMIMFQKSIEHEEKLYEEIGIVSKVIMKKIEQFKKVGTIKYIDENYCILIGENLNSVSEDVINILQDIYGSKRVT